jgi:hypothetical protein
MTTKRQVTASAEPQLVSGPTLLETVWPDASSRPALRTLHRWKKQGFLPFTKIGKLVFYDPVKVQRAIDRQFTVSEISH